MARILVIDDAEHIRIVLSKHLLRAGHTVDTAENGDEGLKLFGLNHYDLVITDVVMPEKDGFEVIMALKQMLSSVRIIVMSGGAARLDTQYLLKTAKTMGADRILPKPLNFLKLQIVVKEVLEGVHEHFAYPVVGDCYEEQ